MSSEYVVMTALNNFRNQNNRESVHNWDGVVADYCFQHCLAMSKNNNIYHAAPHHLDRWSECVAMSMVNTGNSLDILNDMIFNVLGQSDEHKNSLLNANVIAGGLVINNSVAYLTIRTK